MTTVVQVYRGRRGKTYRLATAQDMVNYLAAEQALAARRQALWAEWGMDPVPDKPLPALETLGFRVQRYGLIRWGDLYNARQALTLVTFAQKVRQAPARMLDEGTAPELAQVVTTYLGIILDRLADKNASLVVYNVVGEKVEHVFDWQALQMAWDYVEVNPFADAGWPNAQQWDERVLVHLVRIPTDDSQLPEICQGSATALPWPDDSFDAVLTDPPYYDNVPYSDLSDFFYVWLKRTIGDLYPDLLATPLTPKSQELVADASKAGGMEAANQRFEEGLTQAFREIHRVLKPEEIAVIVFAHKTTAAWEAILKALLDAGLYLTASWPIEVERSSRLRAQRSAALASAIYMVCRKRTSSEIGEYARVRREIEERVRQKLEQFWDQGIRGADFFMSAIGPAVQVFGWYARVEKLSGEPVTVPELLACVREVISEFALRRILHAAELGGVDGMTRFYLLYRWTYNHARVRFDEARKLAQSVGVELTELWGPAGLVVQEKEYVRVPAPHERAQDKRFQKQARFTTMINALHYAVWLWNENQGQRLKEHLAMTYGGNEVFWQVAQAIAEVLPEGDKER